MESDRERLSGVRPRIARRDPAELRDAWRRRSLAGGWLAAEDWNSDAVDEVAAAACGAEALSVACVRLGRSRATAGIGIAETIEDLAALFAVLDSQAPDSQAPDSQAPDGGPFDGGPAGESAGGSGPSLPLVCALAEGWAEESLAQLSVAGCEDSLSGLATVPYLRTRLAELYREAAQAGTCPADTHRLLVVSLPRRTDPWRRMAQAILVGHELRGAFPGGETLSLSRRNEVIGTDLAAIALVRAGPDLPVRYARLRRTIRGIFGVQVRMAPLPGLLPDALHLVDEMTS